MANVVVNARFLGEGYRPDLPARDLDLAEIAQLTPEQRDLLSRMAGLYELTWGDDGEEALAEQTELASDLEGLRKPALIALAIELGLDATGTVADLRARIDAERPAGTVVPAAETASTESTDAAAGEEGTPA